MSLNDEFATESSNLPAVATVTAPVIAAAATMLTDIRKVGPLATNFEYNAAAEALKTVKHNLKMVDQLEEGEKRPHLDELVKIRAAYQPSRTAYSLAEAHLKKLMAAYLCEKERLRREAQREAEAEAEREREKLRKKAEKALQKGKDEQALQLAERAEAIVAPVIHDETPKVSGVHTVEKWEFEVVDEEQVPAIYKIVDMAALAKIVSTLKEAARKIPGIRVFSKTVVASTSKQPEQS
jgi:hypothetical protein